MDIGYTYFEEERPITLTREEWLNGLKNMVTKKILLMQNHGFLKCLKCSIL